MYALMQAGAYLAPLFYFLFIVLVGFLIFELFVAVISAQFAEVRATTKSAFVNQTEPGPSPERACWSWLKEHRNRRLLPAKMVAFCKALVTRDAFTRVSLFFVLVNTAVLASTYYGMSAQTISILNWIANALIIVFTSEMLLKLCAFGVVAYFMERMFMIK